MSNGSGRASKTASASSGGLDQTQGNIFAGVARGYRIGLAILCLAIGPLVVPCARAGDEPNQDVIQLVIDLLQDKDKEVRALGLEQVRAEAKGEAATRQFAALLPTLPSDAQVSLLSALADRGDAAARPAVLDLLKAKTGEAVRAAAIETLGSLGQTQDLGLLILALRSTSPLERDAAHKSLVHLRGENWSSAIAKQMDQAQPEIRVALIEVLAARRAFDQLSHIVPAASDDDPKVRAAAMAALGQLGGPDQLPGMLAGVVKAGKGAEREAAERAVTLVCGRIADLDQRAQPVLAAMDHFPPADRDALLPTVGRIGGPAALAAIESAVVDSKPQRREVGLRALCNWPDASIAPRLIELIHSEHDAKRRAMLLAALIRVATLPDKRPPAERLALLKTALGMCMADDERNLVLKRARAIRTIETLRFTVPYIDQPPYAEVACETVVELAHHRGLREPNKAEFDLALDKVIKTSKDSIVIERATRYKKGQTWVRQQQP